MFLLHSSQEHQVDNKSMTLDETSLKQVVYLYKCVNSALVVKGKVNSIILGRSTCRTIRHGSRNFGRGGGGGGGGVQPSKKFDKQTGKKIIWQNGKKGKGGFSICSALVWLKSIFAIETASQTISL